MLAQTWRPRGEPICIEIYSTGRANVSKARNYTDLLESFSRMIPELLRYSSSSSGVIEEGIEEMEEDFEDEDVRSSHTKLLEESTTKPNQEDVMDWSEGWVNNTKGSSLQTQNRRKPTNELENDGVNIDHREAQAEYDQHDLEDQHNQHADEEDLDVPDWYNALMKKKDTHVSTHSTHYVEERDKSLPQTQNIQSNPLTGRQRLIERQRQMDKSELMKPLKVSRIGMLNHFGSQKKTDLRGNKFSDYTENSTRGLQLEAKTHLQSLPHISSTSSTSSTSFTPALYQSSSSKTSISHPHVTNGSIDPYILQQHDDSDSDDPMSNWVAGPGF